MSRCCSSSERLRFGTWHGRKRRTPADSKPPVQRSDFRIVVTTSGELRAPKFVNITGPQNMQQAEIWNGVKIQSIVAEGTQVKEGDVVAELDRSPVASKLADVGLALQRRRRSTNRPRSIRR